VNANRLLSVNELLKEKIMFKVFVSYSTHDLTNVAQLQQSLSGTGVEVFVAENSVIPGQPLSEKISSAIASCDLFVLIWSVNAKNSEWVSQEIGKAHSLNKQILPLVLTNGLTLPGFISELKYLPVFKDPEAEILKARTIVLDGLNAKRALVAKQKQGEAIAWLGVGAFVLWAFSQK